MPSLSWLATTATLLVSALAASPAATVVIETSHGGAGSDLTNTTVSIPINNVYNNATALAQVSTLYLVGASGVPASSITCTPFSQSNGSGKAGLAFNTSTPSYLSTNDIDVASVVCITTSISQAPGLPIGASSTSALPGPGSTTLVTSKPISGGSSSASTTPTSSNTVGTNPNTVGPTASPATASASQSAGNAANGLSLSGDIFGGLALAGFAFAFAL